MNDKGVTSKLFLYVGSNITCQGLILKAVINHTHWKVRALDIRSKEIPPPSQAAVFIISEQNEFCLSKSWCWDQTILMDYPAKNYEISLLFASYYIRQCTGSPAVSGCLRNYVIRLKKRLIDCGTTINTQFLLWHKLQNVLTANPEALSFSPCRVCYLIIHKASVSFF